MNPSSQIGIARRAHLAGAFAAVAGLVLALSLLLATAAPGAEAQGDIPLEPDELGLDPLPGGGVTGLRRTGECTHSRRSVTGSLSAGRS